MVRYWRQTNSFLSHRASEIQVDENLPRSAAQVLTGAGHDVDGVAEEGLTGASRSCSRSPSATVGLPATRQTVCRCPRRRRANSC